jgi:alkanesulfonate monooxygenase SsuD/methylene tetrahydromethanopterin reductase-like flavin-dependent oxidoreductase (luciferase family)
VEIGIGLPTTLEAAGPAVLAWARRAEERGFASLATIDRIVYPSYDSLTALAAAAGATSRIRLFPNILIAPLYPPVWLAKAATSLQSLSGGRLTLGVAVGGREDDYAAVDRPFGARGRLLDETLDLLRRAASGEPVAGGDLPVGPAVPGGRVPVLVGGSGAAAIRRTVEYGDGWASGGAPPEQAGQMADRIRHAWRDAGRDGEPRLTALTYYGLGDQAASRAALRHYYAFLGEWADTIAQSAVSTPEQASAAVRAFADAGFTELVFDPTVAALDEVDRLADAVL